MRLWSWILLMAVVASIGCQGQRDTGGNGPSLTPERKAAVEDGVRRFVLRLAQDVTQEGPAAWRKEFADTPSFFMASEGHMVFANGQAAAQGIQDLTRMIKHIELRWGNDLRVDPLTPDLAVVATSWQEVREDMEGHQVTESGFFTGVAEQRNGQWRFRNAHWSVAAPPAKAP